MGNTAVASRQEGPAPLQSLGAARAKADDGHALTDLGQMLAGLSPELRRGIWVYAILPEGASVPARAAAVVAESEGRTVVLRAEDAESLRLTPLFRGRWITLRVHSCLSAVGLTARVAAALAEEGVPANMLAGYSHDHLLVPENLAERALHCLQRLQAGAARHLSDTCTTVNALENVP